MAKERGYWKMEKRQKIRTYELTAMAMITALMCILAPFSVPLPGGVPISFTNMVIYLTVYLLGGKRGTICYCVYLLIGLIGVPVFSGFTSGPAKLVGPTGGYLIGFIFMAMICGAFCAVGKHNIPIYIVGMLLGLAAAYAFGTAWFMYAYKMGLMETLLVCVIPFLGGDALKIAAVAVAGPLIRTRLNKAGVVFC
jgi:biotin transport system substrate-specific component